MSEWITDRKPTAEDTSQQLDFCVWTCDEGKSVMWSYDGVILGQPWMPITPPEAYVKPKRYYVRDRIGEIGQGYYVWNCQSERFVTCVRVPTREAAERIAAIYEEALP